MKPQIEIQVTGRVLGFPYDDEDITAATARLVLEAEQNGNNGKARIHLSPTSHRVVNAPELERPSLQKLANLCDRHKITQLPRPTTSVCEDCADERKIING